jgi:hypothetical protein
MIERSKASVIEPTWFVYAPLNTAPFVENTTEMVGFVTPTYRVSLKSSVGV